MGGRESGFEEVEGLERRDGTTRWRRRESGTRTWSSRPALAATPAKGAARWEDRAARTGRPLRRGLSPLCRNGRRQRARCQSSPQASETGADLRRVASTVIPSACGTCRGKNTPRSASTGGDRRRRGCGQTLPDGCHVWVHELGVRRFQLSLLSEVARLRLNVVIVIMIPQLVRTARYDHTIWCLTWSCDHKYDPIVLLTINDGFSIRRRCLGLESWSFRRSAKRLTESQKLSLLIMSKMI